MSDYTEPTAEQVEQINSSIRYAAYSVFRAASPLPQDRSGLADQVRELFAELADQGLVVRGVYDVSGLRADADLLIWWHAAKTYLCVYPFVRSYDWYVMDDGERRRMLREHGEAARDYKDVLANTISAFALGDYEWLLAFEADELHRIVDLMRDLRATDARLHVREEVPFFTGPLVELDALVASLP